MKKTRLINLTICLLLTSCGFHFTTPDGPPADDIDVSTIQNATPKIEAKSRYGNPKQYSVMGHTYYVMNNSDNFNQAGTASWYGKQFHGRLTSNKEPYDMAKMTAAHKTLPLPSYVKVTRQDNGESIIVRVNDRGPFVDDRIIDLSYAAAKKLHMLKTGTAPVTLSILTPTTLETLQLGVFKNKNLALAYQKKIAEITNKTVAIKNNHHLFKVLLDNPGQDTIDLLKKNQIHFIKTKKISAI